MALDLTQMVLEVRKCLKPTQFYMLNIFCLNNFPKNQALGASLLSAYSWLSMALDLAQMVLEVRKNPKPTKFYMLNKLCFNNFPKKLIPGDVRAQVLQETVGASGADQGRKFGSASIRSSSGGQELSNSTSNMPLPSLGSIFHQDKCQI